MSELTTEKAIGIIADDLCFETGGIDEPHTNGCAQEAVAKAWLAQVRREAKIEALREAADAALAVREAHCKVWPWPGSPEWSEAARLATCTIPGKFIHLRKTKSRPSYQKKPSSGRQNSTHGPGG